MNNNRRELKPDTKRNSRVSGIAGHASNRDHRGTGSTSDNRSVNDDNPTLHANRRGSASDNPVFRSGFVTLVGRPNTGKSTLLNALVGTKVAITSDRPQTTRRVIRGIVNRPHAQLVVVDTPGLHKPRTALGQRLNDSVHDNLAEVDVIAVCLPANEPAGAGDRRIADHLRRLRSDTRTLPRIVALVTKTDTVSRAKLPAALLAAQHLLQPDEVVPVSALTGYQVDTVAEVLVGLLPSGPQLYPSEEISDQSQHVMIAELVREAALEQLHAEVPHSVAVYVDEIVPSPDRPAGKELLDVHVSIAVERDSQKGIILGGGGSRLRAIGTQARPAIEALLGSKVFLDLHVRVMKDWQTNPKQLDRLGF